jgi:predicted nucleic acid-binding protein
MILIPQTVYIETSIVSYLTARPSRDLIVAANQQVTYEWWENHRNHFQLYISSLVIKEAECGDKEAAQKRLQILQDIPLLEWNAEISDLANSFVKQKALSDKSKDDALHIATATVYNLDYLLSWNCRHIANEEIQKKVAKICAEMGYEMPRICTPLTLRGD